LIIDVEVRDTDTKGKGVFALRDFHKGEFIFRRRNGRVVTTAEISSLSSEDQMHLTELGFDSYAIVLPPGAYLNHSCDPNAMRSGVKVFAWRAIRAGEEITIDYRLNAFGDGDRWECSCGSENCPGWVEGSFFGMDPERQELLLPYAPPFIRREYRRRNATAK
jgi:hypothetical protein